LKLREGVPVNDLAAQLGHSRKSMTLDTYSHVLLS
jgi:integrase